MRRILIIGATSAIAEYCARIWAARGDELYLVGRNKQRINTIAYDLKLRGASNVGSYYTDLNDLDKHNELIDKVYETLGDLDVVLIAHGTLSKQKICEKSVKDTLTEIQTNAISTISLLTLIANKLEKKKSGTIAVISSVAGDRGRASNYIYGSAKAMVNAFTSGLRQRLYKSNVAVVTIKPGFVDTPMTAEFKKGIMWAKPNAVAMKIVQAIDVKQNQVYVPKFWWLIMLLIKILPIFVFKRIRL